MSDDGRTDKGYDSGEAIAASQQTGDKLPVGVRHPVHEGGDMDNPGATGAIDPDQPSPMNTAAGFSVGGTGSGIEAGTDASLGLNDPNAQEAAISDAYGEQAADMDFDRTAGDGALR